jgi:transposase-like protein
MSEDTAKPKAEVGSIPDPEVKSDKPRSKSRRYLTAGYKLKILGEADACKPGEVVALLRREGLYSSHLSAWKKERDEGKLSAGVETRRGPKPELTALEAENQELKQKNDKLTLERDQAYKLIEAQKKIAEIFGISHPESSPRSRRGKP